MSTWPSLILFAYMKGRLCRNTDVPLGPLGHARHERCKTVRGREGEVSLDPRGFCHRPTDGPPKDGFLGLEHVGWAHLSEPRACEKFWSQSQQNCHFHCLVTKSCLTLCNLMDCRPPGTSVHGISQARILKWVVISFSRASSQPRDRTQVS